MVTKDQNNGLIIGLADNLIPKEVAILQYDNETIIFLEEDTYMAINVKLLLYLYELMFGSKMNFTKSEVILIHAHDGKCVQYA